MAVFVIRAIIRNNAGSDFSGTVATKIMKAPSQVSAPVVETAEAPEMANDTVAVVSDVAVLASNTITVVETNNVSNNQTQKEVVGKEGKVTMRTVASTKQREAELRRQIAEATAVNK